MIFWSCLSRIAPPWPGTRFWSVEVDKVPKTFPFTHLSMDILCFLLCWSFGPYGGWFICLRGAFRARWPPLLSLQHALSVTYSRSAFVAPCLARAEPPWRQYDCWGKLAAIARWFCCRLWSNLQGYGDSSVNRRLHPGEAAGGHAVFGLEVFAS